MEFELAPKILLEHVMHPTFSEAVKEAALSVDKAIHS